MRTVTIMVLLLGLSFFQDAKGQVIGNVDKTGVPYLTFSTGELLDSWNKLIEPAALGIRLNNVGIVRSEGDYFLIATGDGYRSAALLEINAATRELSLARPEGRISTCTSKSCSDSKTSGMPQRNGACSPCTAAPSDCIRSTSNATYLF